jgi:hypothetical protein
MKRHAYVVKGVERAAARMQCPVPKECEHASCKESEITERVKQCLLEAIEDFEVRIQRGPDADMEEYKKAIVRLEKRLAELEKLEASQWEKYTLEGMPKHIFEQLNAKVLAEKEEVTQSLCNAKNSLPEPINLEERVSTFREVVEMLDNPESDPRLVNALLKECIVRIDYRRPSAQGLARHWRTGAPFELDIELRI